MKRSVLAPICSAFIIPGAGQVINRQLGKGLALIGATTVIILVLVVKIIMDLSNVMSRIPLDKIGGDEMAPLIIEGMRGRNMTTLLIIVLIGFALWVYGIVDAYINGRKEIIASDKED